MCKVIALVNRSTTQLDSLTSTAYSLFSHTEMAEIGRHTSELQSPVPISYAVFCLKKKKNKNNEKSLITSTQ